MFIDVHRCVRVCVCALIHHVACDLNLRDGDGGRERERCDTPVPDLAFMQPASDLHLCAINVPSRSHL